MNIKHVVDVYKEHMGSGERVAAAIAVKAADTSAFDTINDLIEETTYTRRNYGRGQFYCWAHHALLPVSDPWPAARFPRAVLFVMFAQAMLGHGYKETTK